MNVKLAFLDSISPEISKLEQRKKAIVQELKEINEQLILMQTQLEVFDACTNRVFVNSPSNGSRKV